MRIIEAWTGPAGDRVEERTGGECLEVSLAHPEAAYAATVALAGMTDEPPEVDGRLIRLAVPQRTGAVMEAARRLHRAGVRVDDLVFRSPSFDDAFRAPPARAA